MRFIIADTFMKSLASLDKSEQNQVRQAALEFQVSPERPGSRFHKLDRARDPRFWSFRVNRDVRIIVHREGSSSLMLCYADHHDAAYQWAERRTLDVHPRTGAAQFVEVQERVEEVVRQVVREQEAPLFAKYEKEYLLGLGVPAEWVDALRTVGETAFLEVVEELPEEAAERLIDLAEGKAVPLPAAAATTDPFEHPDAQRRFQPVSSQQELQSALEAPWDRWRIFLHPDQRELATQRRSGPARVTGGAGTGKSVVALHRAATLARTFSESRVLLTTFSRALAVRLEHSLELLMGDDPARARIDVRHLHAVAASIAQRQGRSFEAASAAELTECIERAVAGRENDWLTAAFIVSEWEGVVDLHGISTWEAYRGVSRKGRGVALSAKKRKLVWAVMEALLAQLSSRGKSTFNLLCSAAAEGIADEPPYEHVIVDECQDFGPAELRLVRALADSGGDDLFFCGDEGQRIYKPLVSWLSLGIDVRGRSGRLITNYRTTAQIRRCADALLPAKVESGDGEAESNETRSVHNGPPPQFVGYNSAQAEQAGLAEWLKAQQSDGLALREIALFARTTRRLEEVGHPALKQVGFEHQALRGESIPELDQVVCGTLHGAKGLEFRAVAIVGCDRDQVPLRSVARRLRDDAARAEFIEHERHLLYVGCTRARDRLRVSWSGKPCEWLLDSKSDARLAAE